MRKFRSRPLRFGEPLGHLREALGQVADLVPTARGKLVS
jgi:hypothetical protein